MPEWLQTSPQVQQALNDGRPVVALESTLISHGLPYPQSLETARMLEETVRAHGATPATIAILEGIPRVGLDPEALAYLARNEDILKVSRRDLPIVVARGGDGATTVAATMVLAAAAGIQVFATGGIGGVHRGQPFDVSADLPELEQTPVAVVCAGAKAILDLPLTLEWLETHGVPVLGYGTDSLPAFYTYSSGLPVDARVDTPHEPPSRTPHQRASTAES
jgi:pseudouridine-5'-phosphate glycosidase